MFKLIGLVIKTLFFSAIVLVAAHYIKWDGRTVSDQVRSGLSSAERSTPLRSISNSSRDLLDEARDAVTNKGEPKTEIPAKDRAQLQDLIGTSTAQ